jgi:CubicO group peptidase (beta-lactamase class C family)
MLVALVIVIGIVAVAALPFFLLTPRPPRPPAGIASIAGLEIHIRDLVANETPPALVVTVVKDGATIYSKAFGAVDASGTPASPDHVFHFWSVTKLFTATAIMQLVEDGRLALDDLVTAYLPEFETALGSGTPAPVTIRRLLDHTSGMKDLGPRHLLGWVHHPGDPPVSETAIVRNRMAAYRRLASEPGKTGTYSNAGYIVLGAVIEKVSGQSYEDFVRQRILVPLAMERTDFIYRDDMPLVASGSHPLFHVFTPLLLLIHRDWFSAWVAKTLRRRMWLAPLYTDYMAPTGLIGTGQDLARFGEAFLKGGALAGARILKPESVSAMLAEGYGGNTGPDGDRMGLGWHWWDRTSLPFKGHGGEGPGFSAQLALLPAENMVVVILANDTLTDRVGITELVAKVFR